MKKVSSSFHEKLPMRRLNLAQVLPLFAEGRTERTTLGSETSLGSNEVKAAPSWLRSCGLSDEDRKLTNFGAFALEHDPALEKSETQWIMHYHLSAAHTAGPQWWGLLVGKFFGLSGEEVSKNEAADYIEDGPNQDAVRSFVTIMLNAYATPDGLGNLQILQAADNQNYLVQNPVPVPWAVMAYVLADFWQAEWGQTLSVPFANLNGANGPAALLLQNSGQMGQLLKAMQEAGILEVSRVTRPWTVLRKWDDPNALLEMVYRDDAYDAADATHST